MVPIIYVYVTFIGQCHSADRLLTAEIRVQFMVTSSEIRGGRSRTREGSLHILRFIPANHHSTIAPYSSITPPPHEMCDSPDQAAHCHTICPKIVGLFLIQPLASLGMRVVPLFNVHKI
jgi:hypothetical protein